MDFDIAMKKIKLTRIPLKKSLLIIPLMMMVFSFLIVTNSCKSPLEVDALRDKDTIFDPNNKPALIKFEPNILDFDMVFPNDESDLEFIIENISKSDVLINQFTHKNSNSTFNLAEEFQPFTLKTSAPDKSKKLKMIFSSSQSGTFIDTVFVNNFQKTILILKAKVPDIYGRDLLFDNTTKGGISGKVLRIFNESQDSVTIAEFSITENQNIFFEEPKIQLPLIIPPKSSINIVVNFNPSEAKTYDSEIRIKVKTDGIVDEIIKLSGTGTNQ